jgi:hypothetical protein
MKRFLLHLHPDLQEPLVKILSSWNRAQKAIRFIPLCPRRTHEHVLLTPGTIHENDASKIADKIRTDAGYSKRDSVLVFTEKRLYTDEFYQLFVGGRGPSEVPPNITILSLHFLRATYEKGGSGKHMLLRAVLSNILFSIGADNGLDDHDDELRGCIMDFCEYMPDIEEGLKDGPRFCPDCVAFLKEERASFLLALAKATRDFPELKSLDRKATKSIVLRGKRYKKIAGGFDYHVALSFAGPDRPKANKLANALKKVSLKVFYDADHQAELWGKNLQMHLTELYRLRACFCIVLLSVHYSKSRWTRAELEAALAREFESGKEYVLPLRLDDSKVSGILPIKAYVNWGDQSVEAVSKMVRQKLAKSGRLKRPAKHVV